MKKQLMLLALLTATNLAYAQDYEYAGECPGYNINISTGIDNAGNLLPLGTIDPNWSAPPGLQATTPILMPAWSTFPGSRWLGTFVNQFGTYTYTRSFTIPPGCVGTMAFQALADNNADIYLDGTLIAQTISSGSINGYNMIFVINYTGTICPGDHTLTADVHNDDLFYPNPVGFNLSGNVGYKIVNTSIDISTGLGTNYVLLPPGATDPNWICSVSGYTNVTLPFSTWDNLAGSEWIGDITQQNTSGIYSYDRSFNVPASEGCLMFEALADNTVELSLDGNPIAYTQWMTGSGFQFPYRAIYSGGVSAGAHTLEAKVHNNEYQVGLNLHGSFIYCTSSADAGEWGACTTDPGFTAIKGDPYTANFYCSTNPVNYPSPSVSIAHYWDFGDGSNSTLADPAHGYSGPGTYSVTHTINKTIYSYLNGQVSSIHCESTQTCQVTIGPEGEVSISCGGGVPPQKPSSTADIPALPGDITVFPNPAYNELHISGNVQGCDLQIFSLDGRKLIEQKDFRGNKIDISSLAKGIYTCRIIQGKGITNITFSKAE